MFACFRIRFTILFLSSIILTPSVFSQPEPVLHVLDFRTIPFETLNPNIHLEEVHHDRFSGVSFYEQGYHVQTGQGRDGSTAAYCENDLGNQSLGLSWTFTLDQTQLEPVRMTGWSRAENVQGSPDSDYSLYIDIVHQDGTISWGHQVSFDTGTHDWQEKTLLVIPEKPIRSLSCYALFRNKQGRVWFDDITIEKAAYETGMMRLDGISVQPGVQAASPESSLPLKTNELSTRIDPGNGALVSLAIHKQELPLTGAARGFLVRDVGSGSDYYSFQNGQCSALNCRLDLAIDSTEQAIRFQGRLTDGNGSPRAVNLLYAIPLDAVGGQWGDQIAASRMIATPEDFHSWTQIGVGSNGQISRYPFAAIWTENTGLALGFDMEKLCQWRLGYSSATRIFYLSMDFGLHPGTKNFPSQAEFSFVIYATDPAWGFRSATERYYQIDPDSFTVRSHDQGIWMPFTDVSQVQGWQDFGFKYHEGTNNIAFDDSAGILSFRYSEPSTWWMNMDTRVPRTYEAAMDQVKRLAESSSDDPSKNHALALLTSGTFDENGHYQMEFRNEPWSNGAVFSLNPSPYLSGAITDASLMWNETLAERLYDSNAKGVQDGEYLDSLEGYVTADLNFREDHFRDTTVPLTFTFDTHRPVIYKAFSIYEFTRSMGEQVHARGKLLFANSVPSRYPFLCPWIDVMGTETNWIRDGKFSPESDETLNFRRTAIGQKPYLFLMNTDFNFMTYAIVEQYFQRCLFYGMYPSMFSHNASSDPYWENAKLYNRDRPLFLKYQPLIKTVAQAGWQPITLVRANDSSIRLERFSASEEGVHYLTVWNSGPKSITGNLKGENEFNQNGHWKELLSETEGEWNRGLETKLDPNDIRVYRIILPKKSAVQDSGLN